MHRDIYPIGIIEENIDAQSMGIMPARVGCG
jgi:hypothetical protein